MSAPAFARRHYCAVAAILARAAARAEHNDTTAEVVSDLVQDFVDAFRVDNPDFKPSRFVEASRAKLGRIPDGTVIEGRFPEA